MSSASSSQDAAADGDGTQRLRSRHGGDGHQPADPFLDRLIQPIRENINGSSDLGEPWYNALASASTLLQRSTVLTDAKASGALKLVVGCFQLNSGVVSLIE